MECFINTPSNFLNSGQSYDLTIVDSQSTMEYEFDFGGIVTSSDNAVCPISGVYHADVDSSVFSKPSVFVEATSTVSGSKYVS